MMKCTDFTDFFSIPGTYAIQDCILNKSQSNEVLLDIVYLENTAAMGALLLFISKNTPPVMLALERQESKMYSLPLHMAKKKVLTYDIEESGLLMFGINYPSTNPKYIPDMKNNIGEIEIEK